MAFEAVADRVRADLDLWAVTLASLALAVLIGRAPEHASVARAALAFLVILVAPGYALHVLLFPRRDHLAGVERIAMSLGLSVVAIPPIGAAIAATGEGLAPHATAWAVTGGVALLAVLSSLRRATVPPAERFVFAPGAPGFRAVLAVGAALLALCGGVVALSARLAPPGPDTEFYVLGTDGTLEAYGRQLVPGATFTLTPGIVNHEAEARSYVLRFPFGDNPDVSVGPLPPGEAWEREVTLTAPPDTGCVELPLLLLRDGDAGEAPHRRLRVSLPIFDEPVRAPWEACR